MIIVGQAVLLSYATGSLGDGGPRDDQQSTWPQIVICLTTAQRVTEMNQMSIINATGRFGICHRIRVGRAGRRTETLLEPLKYLKNGKSVNGELIGIHGWDTE